MTKGKIILEQVINILRTKHSTIDIKHKELENNFYYIKFSVNAPNSRRINYILSDEPYSELDTWKVDDLVKRILDIVNRGLASRE